MMELKPEVRRRLARVRLLMLDVDGVQTDGGLYYTEQGAEFRRFDVRDGLGIKRIMDAGLYVVFLTHSTTASIKARAAKLGVTRCLTGISDKLATARTICSELGVELSESAYMGDDLNDIELLRAVGCPATVADAVREVAAEVIWQSEKPGGAGAVREFCDVIVALRGNLNESVARGT